MRARITWIGYVVAGLMTITATAGPSQSEQSGRRAHAQAKREEIQGLMDAYILSKLEESLELDEEQFARMVIAHRELRRNRRQYQERRRVMLQRLHRLLAVPSSSDPQIERVLGELEDAKLEYERQARQDYRAIDAILTVRQRARYRLLEIELERRLQALIRDIRGRQAPREPQRPNR